MPELSVATLRRVIRKAEPRCRVSDSAALELAAVLEEEGVRIAHQALELARHRGAKTVSGEDVRAAAKER